MSILLPPRRLIHPARNGRVQSLWDKCILAIPFWSGVPRDVSGNDVPVNLVGAPPIVPTDIGYALDLNGSSQAAWADLPVLAPAFRSNRISVTIVYKQRTDQGASYYELSPIFSSSPYDKTFRHADLGTYDGLQVGGDFSEILRKDYDRPPLGEWSLSTNRFEHAPDGGTVMRADRWLSGNEQPVASLVRDDSTSLTGAFGNHEIYFGARAANANFFDGQIAAFIIHDRMLSEAEIRLLGRDPFVMFRQDSIEIISMAGEAAAGGTTTFGATTGAVVASGNSATLSRSISLAAQTGAVAATGADAALSKRVLLSATSGIAIAAGVDAALGGDTTFGAASGVAKVTGQPASLAIHRAFPAQAGHAVATGADASLPASRTLGAETAGIFATGAPASIALRRVLAARIGTVEASGADAAILRRLIAGLDAGVITATGADAIISDSLSENIAVARVTVIWDEPAATAVWDEPAATAVWRQ